MPERVSLVMPVRNGAPWLSRALSALLEQFPGAEVIVVDDGSADESLAIVDLFAASHDVRVLHGARRGAAAALNLGLAAASCDLVVQVDQDVEILPGWADAVLAGFDAPDVAAVQACYVPDPCAPAIARVMALDLALRYARLAGATNHVCTGNTAYRRAALAAVGPFDERLGYGYDNDLSYRLVAAGWSLRIAPQGQSLHHWRHGIWDYLGQQYGFGYGRLDLVAKHPRRIAGDTVSPAPMMAHPLVFAAACIALVAAAVSDAAGAPSSQLALTGASLVGLLAAERLHAGIWAARRQHDWAGLLFPIVHLARDGAWVAAIVVWLTRQAFRGRHLPGHSMRPRPVIQGDQRSN